MLGYIVGFEVQSSFLMNKDAILKWNCYMIDVLRFADFIVMTS
jgi:hypothetical protein